MKHTSLFNLLTVLSLIVASAASLLRPVAAWAGGPEEGLIAYYPFNGNADDESGNGNHGTVFGATLSEDKEGNEESAFSFDGVDDYIDLGGGVNPGTEGSFVVWFKANSLLSLQGLLHKYTSDTPPPNPPGGDWQQRCYYVLLVENRVRVAVSPVPGGDGGEGVVVFDSAQTVETGVWYQVAVTVDASAIRLYIDAVQDENSGEGLPQITNSTLPTIVGNNNYPGHPIEEPFDGILDEIRFYDRALSEAEIQQLYQGAISLVAIPEQIEVYPGDAVAVDLEIQAAADLYAAQVEVAADPAILEPLAGVFGGFFDPVHRLVAANEVDPAAGTWLGAISQQRPAEPLTGDGLLATVTYQALAPGTTALAGEPLLSSRDGFALPVSFSGADVTVLPFAILSGTVTYQGRLAHEGIEVTAAGPVTSTTTTGDDGGFLLENLRGGDYAVTADAQLYLPTCTTAIVSSGGVTVLAPARLWGGDLNDDGCIGIGDATLLTANFGQGVPPADPRADVNGDGLVNVQDLAILAGNYELCGCQEW